MGCRLQQMVQAFHPLHLMMASRFRIIPFTGTLSKAKTDCGIALGREKDIVIINLRSSKPTLSEFLPGLCLTGLPYQ